MNPDPSTPADQRQSIYIMAANLPKTMKALQYSKPEQYGLVELPLPELRENDVLV